jgi:hypothetical protein
MKSSRKPNTIAFPFVLDSLIDFRPVVRPMFGCHAVYIGEKIVLATRQKGDDDDGVWVATSQEHHVSLRKEFPSMRSIFVLGSGKETGWQIIPLSSATFEEEVFGIIDQIKRSDLRIGKLPKKRSPTTRNVRPTRKR